MLQVLPSLITNIENYRQSTRYGQVGFFDLGQVNNDPFEFELPDVPEFSKNELLKMEKDMTGLYLSGHPMDKYANLCKSLGFAYTIDLIDADNDSMSKYKDKCLVKLCGIVTHVTLKPTRNGATMAFVTVEDLYGSIEVIVFPKTLEKYSQLIYEGGVICVSGSLSLEEQKDAKILAGEILPPPNSSDVKNNQDDSTQQKKHKRVGLFLRFKSKDDDNIRLAKRVTTIFDGTIPLYFYYIDSGKYELQPKSDFVEVNKTQLNELKRILGDENVVYLS
jgi:DNA polymerase-3 subunit alpha